MWQAAWHDPLSRFLDQFDDLIGDARTRTTLTGVVQGILASGTTICGQIAAHAPALQGRYGEERVRRFVKGTSCTRSPDLDAEHLMTRLREHTLAHLQTAAPAEVWLILDGSEARKPHARHLPYLQKVPALEGGTVRGYPTLTVLAVIPGYRGILYQHIYSSRDPAFRSEPLEVQEALTTVGQATQAALPDCQITWIMDRGFDDIAVWRTIWGLGQHVVCRAYHDERLVDLHQAGTWVASTIGGAAGQARRRATVETTLEVRLVGQPTAKRQPVTVDIASQRMRLSYEAAGRTEIPTGNQIRRWVWVVVIQIRDCAWEPWVLVTDWAVQDAPAAARVFQMYRQRWAIEDAFKFTKECVNWEAAQVLSWEGLRMLVALAWVAAGFLYELGVSLEWAEVRLLARLGGWEERADRPPGRIVLARGLARLLDLLATQALLSEYEEQAGALPPNIAAFLRRDYSPEDL